MTHYSVPIPDFSLRRAALQSHDALELDIQRPTVVLCTQGTAAVRLGDSTAKIDPGTALLAIADIEGRVAVISGMTEVFIATAGNGAH